MHGLLVRHCTWWYCSFDNKLLSRATAFIEDVEQRSDSVATLTEDAHESDIGAHASEKTSQCGRTFP